MKEHLRRLYFGARSTYLRAFSAPVVLHVIGVVDALVMRAAAASVRAGSTTHLVVATAGRGNIGDQALLDSVVQSAVEDDVRVLVDRHDDLVVPRAGSTQSVRFVAVPRLVARLPYLRVRSVWRTGREIARARRMDVIGADIMDGSYSRRDAVIRLQLVEAARRAGVTTRVVGFSWSDAADPMVIRLMRSIQSDTTLLVRDPRSADRLREVGVDRVVPTADVVFTLDAPAEPARARLRLPEEYVVFNASGLASRNRDVDAEYQHCLDVLLAAGRQVVLLPHVLRRGDDDLAVSRSLLQGRGGAQLSLVAEQLSPAGVEDVARGASGALASRMHLAIFLLRNGVAPVSLDSHQKATGLFELFGLEHRVLPADAPFGRAAGSLLTDPERQHHDDATVRRRLPHVRDLALLNVEDRP